MTNFEKITASPDVLGEFLASLPVATGPWDEEFHRAFCDSCELLECRAETCPYKGNRQLWWLMMGAKPGEVPGLSINIKAAFPIEWGREYYTVDAKKKQLRAPCTCCDNTGKVTIKGVEYKCPRCFGNWREQEVIGETTVYSVAKWLLSSVTAQRHGMMMTFERVNGTGKISDTMRVRSADFRDMVCREIRGKSDTHIYNDYKAAMAEVKRLNAAERENRE